MSDIIKSNQSMSSFDLRAIINKARVDHGQKPVANNHFLCRVEDELEGELAGYKTFSPETGGAPVRYYDLTRDQCMLVGMRESKAVRRNVLDKLKALDEPRLPTRPASNLDALQSMVDSLREQEQRVHALESQVDAITKGEAFFTVVGYANRLDVRIDRKRTAAIGKLASGICRREGIETGTAPHPLYGDVNTYPAEVLDMAFDIA